MAKVSNFTYSNTTDSSHTIAPKLLGLVSNYSLTGDVADVVTLNNKTADIDSEEIVQIRSRYAEKVNNLVNVMYPAPVAKPIEYSVRLEDILKVTDTADASFRVDEPISCTIAIRHNKSGNITNAIVAAVVVRALSAFVKADGTWRFDDLMRSAERPVVD
jgi:hypothetical protein